MFLTPLAVTTVVVALSLAVATGDAAVASNSPLRVGAFNIKTFGKTKMSKSSVAWHIKEIVELYDVLLIQEIRDKSVDSVRQLLYMLELPFNFTISEPLGRSTYKEQYAFFYRTDRVELLDEYQYDDPADVFEREPFSVQVAPIFAPHEKITLIGLHARPDEATIEIGHLARAIAETQRVLGCDSELIVMGDLNADCSYSDHEERLLAKDFLTTSPSYTWLIGDDVDTTVKDTTDCAYDRIIVSSSLEARGVTDGAKAFDFGDYFGLTNEEAYEVSDHYPVEVLLHF